MLLVLNKYDLVDELTNSGHQLEEFMTYDFLNDFATDNGFIGAVTTSAKTGQGVTEAISTLVRHILVRELANQEIQDGIGDQLLENNQNNHNGKNVKLSYHENDKIKK